MKGKNLFVLPVLALAVAACDEQSSMTDVKSMTGHLYGTCIKNVLEPSYALMENLKADGLDVTKPRLVTHLFVGSAANITRATTFARSKDFRVLESGSGRLLIGEDVPIIEDWLKHTIAVNCSIASEYGLTYDGWDVDVSKDGLKRK